MYENTGGRLLKPRPREGTEVDLTSMIDVVFLLLVFFMVTSTIQDNSPVTKPPARYHGMADPASSVIITVRAPREFGEEAEIFLEGEAGPTDLDGVRDALEKGLEAGKQIALIVGDAKAPKGRVAAVQREVAEVGGLELKVAIEEMPITQ